MHFKTITNLKTDEVKYYIDHKLVAEEEFLNKEALCIIKRMSYNSSATYYTRNRLMHTHSYN